MNNVKYRNDTELSKHIWKLKDTGKDFVVKWDIIEKCNKYRPGLLYCPLCTAEKYHILKTEKKKSLNCRWELSSKCRHKSKYKLEAVDREILHDSVLDNGHPILLYDLPLKECHVVIENIDHEHHKVSKSDPPTKDCQVVLEELDMSCIDKEKITFHDNDRNALEVPSLRRSTRTRKKKVVFDM